MFLVDQVEVTRLLRRQDGVISRRQVRASGGTDADIDRLVRRRVWVRIHPGVYVDHTGPPSWRQRAWAAVLLLEPAALSGASALRAHGLRGHEDYGGIEVAVPATRHPSAPRASAWFDYECSTR